jgi:prolyl oligopeptidase
MWIAPLVVIASLGVAAPSLSAAGPSASPLAYPPAERSDHVDIYWGTEVPDPYRWLEDPADARTTAWVEAEEALARDFLDALPTHASRESQMTALLRQPSVGSPTTAGGRLFWTANDGTQAQSVLYTSTAGRNAGTILIDPNKLSKDGTVSLASWVPSPDGRYVAWATSDGGSDWQTWRVRDVRTGRDLRDRLRWSKFCAVTWSADSAGFYYCRYPRPADPLESVNTNMQVRFHALGSRQSDNPVVYADPQQPELFVTPYSAAGSSRIWLFLSDGATSDNTLAFVTGDRQAPRVQRLSLDIDASYAVVAQSRHHAWLLTTAEAPNWRVVRVDIRRPASRNWVEVVPESDRTISNVTSIGGRLVVTFEEKASSRVEVYSRGGDLQGAVRLPGVGTVTSLSPNGDRGRAFLGYTSYLQPRKVLTFNVDQRRLRNWYSPPVPFDPADFVTEQVWTTSKDGTRVPAFVSRLRSTTPNGERPTWLYGYGGFNISITPAYSPDAIAWMQSGGVYVVANLRGGGEFGQEWHQAGTLMRKQNVFDDFSGVAEWLIANDWTTPAHLAANGVSNGGLLAGAALTQRPDLFGAVIPEVGVLDMLRYQYFTIGYAWAPDYGRSDDSKEMFEYLLGYSPLHNVKTDVDYPATLIMTAERDDRVVPAHSFKFAATLQHANPDGEPMLIRIERQGGHGAGASLEQAVSRSADRLAFLDAYVG